MHDAELVLAGAEFDRLAEVLDADVVAVDGDGALAGGLGVGEFELHGALAGGDEEDDAEENGRRCGAGGEGEAAGPTGGGWRVAG